MLEILKIFKRNLGKDKFSLDEHIEAGVKWLLRAQDATADDGVSIRYSLLRGWESSYPETTGYIIPTFLKYYDSTGEQPYKERALKMAEWELSIQQEDGSFVGGAFAQPVGKLVFDTGQIMFGLLYAYRYSKDERFLKAAVRAGDWLVGIQDEKGYWEKDSFQKIPHTYHSRVAWAVAQLYEIVEDEKYLTAVKSHMHWVLSNQLGNGWFQNAGFTLENHKAPYTHTIAYTVRGLLETGILFNIQEYINAAIKTIDQLISVMNQGGFCWGKYNSIWEGDKRFCCLTGNAQISIICLRLFHVTNDSKYLEAALALNNYLKSIQQLTIDNQNIRGAIAGSWPIWGEYERFSYPNWATKFFVDALMLEKSYQK